LERAAVRINETVLRQNFISIGHFRVFDDTYSSSPDAVIADLEFLIHLDGAKSCALGDMLELGAYTEAMHRKIGAAAACHGIDKLFLFGKFAKHTEVGAIEAGMPPSKIFINTDLSAPEITAKQIWQTAKENETVLIKASHSLNAYKIIEILERMNKNAR
jgi:UDP-N-acetylmuramoyl-tripeptide--D-alanyl-D-alanine ligase